MLKKKKVCEDPETYRLFEDLPTLDPVYLGTVTAQRSHDDVWRWESALGGNCGSDTMERCITKVILCAQRSDLVKAIKKRGMR